MECCHYERKINHTYLIICIFRFLNEVALRFVREHEANVITSSRRSRFVYCVSVEGALMAQISAHRKHISAQENTVQCPGAASTGHDSRSRWT